MEEVRKPNPTSTAGESVHSSPSSRLALSDEERAEGWRIETLNGTTVKTLRSERLRRVLAPDAGDGE